MASTRSDLENVLVSERHLWVDGPPHELFRELRGGCPVHWTGKITEYPGEAGYWSVTTADDVHTVSRDWQTYSSELGGVTAVSDVFPIELTRAMFIGMDPPKHDRIKALFQAGFTPKRIAAHEEEIRAIAIDVLDRLEGRETCDLVSDVAQPVVSRVIGTFMGIPPEDDEIWANLMNSTLGAGDPDLNPEGIEGVLERDIPEIFERCRQMIAARRENPTDDLTSVLVHAEVDGQKLEEHEIVMGFFLLVAAGQRQHEGDLLQRDERADGESRPAPDPARRHVADTEHRRGGAAHVPRLRALPPHRDARRRAERPADPRRREGRHVVRVVEPRRDALRGPGPLRRAPQPRASGVRRGRPALLPRHGARAARAADPAGGDAEALPGDGDRRDAGVRRVAVPQPAEDAAGQASPSSPRDGRGWRQLRGRLPCAACLPGRRPPHRAA